MAGFLSLLRRVYLSFYNWAVFFGWAQVLFLAVKTLKEDGYQHVYAAIERPLLFAQSAAVLEIIHSLVGLVRSPISATLPQILSRLFLAWGILYSFPEIRIHFFVSSLLLSWSLTEIIRYSFFGMKEAFGFTPSFLLWLRYSTFLLLYPIGISSEIGLAYLSLPYVKTSENFCVRMPNKWNFSFDYHCMYLSNLVVHSRKPSHVHIHAWAEEEDPFKIKKRVTLIKYKFLSYTPFTSSVNFLSDMFYGLQYLYVLEFHL